MDGYTLEPIAQKQEQGYTLEPVGPDALDQAAAGISTVDRWGRGLLETGMAAFSGLYAWPAGKVAGVVTHLMTGDIDAAKSVDEGVSNDLMVKPKSAEGEYITNNLFKVIGAPFEIASEFAKTGVEMAYKTPFRPATVSEEEAGYYADIGAVLSMGGILKGLMKIAKDGVPKGGEAVPEFLKEVTGRGKIAEAERIKVEEAKIVEAEKVAKEVEASKDTPAAEKVEPSQEAIAAVPSVQTVTESPASVEAGPAFKQPWERRKAEYINELSDRNSISLASGEPRNITQGMIDSFAGSHEISVDKALKEGKPVPPEVLKNYPDLLSPLGNERGAIPLKEKPFVPLHEFPEPINARYKAATPAEPTLLDKGKVLLETLQNKLTREYEHLPKTAEFADLRFELLNLSKYKGVASDRATRLLEDIATSLDKPTMDIFEKKVILDDLFYSAERGMDLPYGFTPESLAAEKIIIDDLVLKNPKVAASIARRQAVWEEIKINYSEAMKSIGMDVEERFQNPDYYHHQVLEYAQAKNVFGAGRKLQTPAGRGFLKKRAGSELDINRDYLQVEHDVMAQMIHDIKVANVIRTVDEAHNIAPLLREKAKASGIDDWRTLIPESYDLWQPREGNVFYMSQAVPSKIAEQLLTGTLEEYGITAADLQGIMSVGGKRKEFVLKKEIIETLDNLTKPNHGNIVSKGSAYLMRQWKEKVALLNPRGLFKYNARNISGDAEAVFIGNPSAFSMTPGAFKELWNAFYGDGKMTKDLSDFFEMGGFESTLNALEINKFGDLKAFSHLKDKSGNLLTAPVEIWRSYWKNAQIATSVREATLRYASYLDYLDQMKSSRDGLTPKNFGASIPEEINGLPTAEKRAYWLQNDLLGAYDRVGIIGQELRMHIWPFWSWKEVNFKRYINLWNNAADSVDVAAKIGKALGAKAPYVAYKIGALAIKVTGLMAMLEVYNNTFFKDEEDGLPDNVKKSAHIVFGKDSEGNVIYFDRLGMFSDFLSNFGLDGAHRLVPEVLAGRMTIKEMAKEMAKEPLNVVVNGVSPYFKWPAELLTSKRTFPDVTRMSTIRDKKLYIAEQLKLGDEYKALTDLPSEGYDKSFKRLFAYSSDPGQAAYFDIMDEKRRFAERNGKEGEGFFITPKGNALFNYRMALKYKDTKSAEHYIDQYLLLGGSPQGLAASLRAMDPLSGLNSLEKAQFISEMDEKTYGRFEKAYQYYIDQLMQ